MKQKVFFITPPFTQLNTPYPATAYLKGFLNTQNISSFQTDLGIEVILQLFSRNGLQQLFETIELKNETLSSNCRRIINLKKEYLKTIDPVISFLHDKNPTLAHLICERNYLPESSRFEQLEDLEWAFGTMGIIAGYAAMASLVGAVLFFILGIAAVLHRRNTSEEVLI